MISIDYNSRLKDIERFATALSDRKADLQRAAAEDAGFPVKVTAMEVDLAVQHLRSMQEELDWIADSRPYGTVAAILPYDAPAVVLARLGGAAMLSGNKLRFSFSSQTPRCAEVIAEVAEPFATFEPILRQDNREYGKRCVADEAVRVLFISGASGVGQAYRKNFEAFDKLFFAGPGGMPAAVVFADADLEKAGRFITRRAFINGGQYCTTLKKVLIHRDLYSAMRERILTLVKDFTIGNPLDEQTDIGPIRVERTRHILQRALQSFNGADLLYGGMEGEMVTPMILEMLQGEIPDLELFGPLLLLKPFDDPDQAVQELIQTRYGFLLAFFGTPSAQARDLFHEHFGMVHDNPDFYFTPLRLPFGGKKESGWILERQAGKWIERDGAFLYGKELVHNSNKG